MDLGLASCCGRGGPSGAAIDATAVDMLSGVVESATSVDSEERRKLRPSRWTPERSMASVRAVLGRFEWMFLERNDRASTDQYSGTYVLQYPKNS